MMPFSSSSRVEKLIETSINWCSKLGGYKDYRNIIILFDKKIEKIILSFIEFFICGHIFSV